LARRGGGARPGRRALLAAAAAGGEEEDEDGGECERLGHPDLSIKVYDYGAKTSDRVYHCTRKPLPRHARGRLARPCPRPGSAPLAACARAFRRALGAPGRLPRDRRDARGDDPTAPRR